MADDRLISSLKTKEKLIALTFDDGPDVCYTPRVLGILHRYRIPAAFFCLGSLVGLNREISRRIVASGHIIGNHTWSHPHPERICLKAFQDEVKQTSDIIFNVTGMQPDYFRPPYGELTPEEKRYLDESGYKTALWSVDSIDWSGIPGPRIVANVIPFLHGGAILLHHSAGNVAGTLDALPYIIETAIALDYRFVRLDGHFPPNLP